LLINGKLGLTIVLLIVILLSASTALAGSAQHTIPKIPVPIPSTSLDTEQSGVRLGFGDRGEQVKLLQKLLAAAGFYAGDFDGIFGKYTQAGVADLQKTYDLPVTGIADKIVFTYLERSRNTPDRYGRILVMTATAYTIEDPGCTKYTYRGNLLRKGLVAVDPRIIPLGTRLYVEGYGYAIADDIGSAIKGQRIDLAYENRPEAFQFGVQRVNVYILD
jgi:3D (Asp-Asp-Asp) domain-containing protein